MSRVHLRRGRAYSRNHHDGSRRDFCDLRGRPPLSRFRSLRRGNGADRRASRGVFGSRRGISCELRPWRFCFERGAKTRKASHSGSVNPDRNHGCEQASCASHQDISVFQRGRAVTHQLASGALPALQFYSHRGRQPLERRGISQGRLICFGSGSRFGGRAFHSRGKSPENHRRSEGADGDRRKVSQRSGRPQIR